MKGIDKAFYFLSLIFLFSGCKNEVHLDGNDICSAGDSLVFISDINSNNIHQDSSANYRFRDSVFAKYFSVSEYSFLLRDYLTYPVNRNKEINENLNSIAASREKISEVVEKALRDARIHLQSDSLSIYIFPANPLNLDATRQMGGVYAVTAGSKQILLFIDTKINGWKNMLKGVVAHEYHHAYWTKYNLSKTEIWTLTDYLVFEGRADSFAHLIYPEINFPWTNALSENEKQNLWPEVKGNLKSPDWVLQREIVFGSEKYPHWTGYTFGYNIVQRYLKKNPRLSVKEWTNKNADEIIASVESNID